MSNFVDLSFDESSIDDSDNYVGQGNCFPLKGDAIESNEIYLSNLPITIKITQVYWTSKFNYFRDRVRSPSLSPCLADDATTASEEPASTLNVGKVPSRYEITIKHGPYEWKIVKAYGDILALHREIAFDQVKQRVRQATKTVKSGFGCPPSLEELNKRRLSVFPKRWILTVPEEVLTQRTKLLEDYLQSIVNYKPLRYLEGVMNFFEISPVTFCTRLGTSKFKEGTVMKLPRHQKLAICFYDCAWKQRWCVLKDSYLLLMKPGKFITTKATPTTQRKNPPSTDQLTLQTIVDNENATDPRFIDHKLNTTNTWYHRNRRWFFCKVILMDQFFKVSIEQKTVDTILNIKNMHHDINLRTQRPYDWVAEMSKVVSQPTALDYVQINPNDSFAPVRKDGQLLPCIDGAAYMDAVANGIERAQHEIFITDWWLSPEVFLKRPDGGDRWRLDRLLKRKAEQGVRICILIYREVPQVLSINSKHTSMWLSSLHPNIHVLRHPDHLIDMVLLWSHHEKLVVIDQSIAFVGGIDLCFGRWDRQDHPLIDVNKTKPYTRGKVEGEEGEKGGTSENPLHLGRDSFSAAETDVSHEEVHRSRSKKHGDWDDHPKFVTGAAPASKRPTSPMGGFKVMPDGQVAFCSSMRARKSGRRNRPTQEGGDGGNTGGGGNEEECMPTMDIQIPIIGHIQVPHPEYHRDKPQHSDHLPHTGNQVSASPKVGAWGQIQDQPADAAKPTTGGGTSKTPHKPYFSTAEISTGLQNLFAKVAAQQKKPSGLHAYQDDSDDSEGIEFVNLGYDKRLQGKALNSKNRRGQVMTDMSDVSYDDDENVSSELGELSRQYLFVGKDYGNWILKDAVDLDEPEKDEIDRNEIPRMPWHDVGCVVMGSVVSDYARHFIQRWNATRLRKLKRRRAHSRLPTPPMLLPSPPCEPWIQLGLSAVSDRRHYQSLQLQALRSTTRWSLVVNRGGGMGEENDFSEEPNNLNVTSQFTERSIHNACVDAIRDSEHYVYIENQFFVSWLNDKTMEPDIENANSNFRSSPTALESELQPSLVKNMITQALYDRILRAHREKKPYRVYIILPLLPGFQGDPGSKEKGRSIHYEMLFIRQSLFYGPTALIPRLRFFIPNPMDYISVCGIRKYDFWPDHRLTTEFIYVHSKLMIVDDRKLIIGSANINDRSMLGSRDSELALLAEDIPEVGMLKEVTFAGEKVFVGNVARNFRKSLMAEHLGVMTKESRENINWNYKLLNDPVGDTFYHKVWCRIADSNMKIFDEVFSCLPSNNVESFEKAERLRMEEPMYKSNPKKAEKLVRNIQGHLVTFPDEFLIEEDLIPPQISKENVINPIVWT